MVAGDIALNAENPQIRNVELGSTSTTIIPDGNFSRFDLKSQ
jgi:hypothetical protein